MKFFAKSFFISLFFVLTIFANQTALNDKEAEKSGLELTKSEKEWLAKNEKIRLVVDPNWLPIEGINANTLSFEGIIADIFELISESSKIEFELKITENFSQSVELIKSGEADMLSAVSKTKEREEYLNFSKPLLDISSVVVMKGDASFIGSLNQLNGKKVGVSEGNALHKMLLAKYPNIKIVPIKGVKNALLQLSKNEIDAYLENLEVVSHQINSLGLFNIKVVYRLEEKRTLHSAFLKSLPKEPLTIFNKALSSIPPEEIDRIRTKWTNFKIEKSVDYALVFKILAAVSIVLLVMTYFYYTLKIKVKKATVELRSLLESFDTNVIASKTDLNGTITYASDAFCAISGYTREELVGNSHRIIRDPNMPKELFVELWNTIKAQKIWRGEIRNRKKDGGYYWVDVIIESQYDIRGNHIGYSAIRQNITAQKEVEELKEELEIKVAMRTIDLQKTKDEIEKILANILLPILITSKVERKILYANRYAEIQYQRPIDELIGSSIDDIYTVKNQYHHIVETLDRDGYVENLEERFKTSMGNEFIALLSVTPIIYKGEDAYIGMVTDITKQKNAEEEIRVLHKHTRESIEYASLIQHSLIPSNELFRKYFSDYLVIWHPKDIVGGDIYLFEELRDGECLLFAIDCTGHGVPGAFVTMIVKAIERQIVSNIVYGEEIVSPAKILSVFNKSMKHLLKQESRDSISNAGFDGAIFYYNQKDSIIRYAGTNTPLFYIEGKEMKIIKGDKHSIGYKKSDADFVFKDYEIEAKKDMSFFLATDGYFDQNGGEKGFPFGKKRFKTILEENIEESMADIQEVLMYSLMRYQGDEERNDDVTIIGMKI